MPWAPTERNRVDEWTFRGITGLGEGISSGLAKALQKFDEDKKQREFNTGLFETIKDLRDSGGEPIVPISALEKWDSMNGDKQAGVIAGAARRFTTDQQQAQEKRLSGEAAARENLLWAQGHNEWTGGGNDTAMNLTGPEVETGKAAGKLPLRTSNKSFQWAADPNNPVNWGAIEPMPVDKFGRKVDPKDPKAEVAGLMQPNGVVKFLPKPTDMETFYQHENKMKSSTPTPTPAPTPAGKVRVKSPAGVVGLLPAEQLEQAIAEGYTIAAP